MAKNVLIVDDDATRQPTVTQAMRRAAVEEVAAPARAGVSSAIPERPAFDLILQDLHATATGALAAAVQARSGPQPKGS